MGCFWVIGYIDSAGWEHLHMLTSSLEAVEVYYQLQSAVNERYNSELIQAKLWELSQSHKQACESIVSELPLQCQRGFGHWSWILSCSEVQSVAQFCYSTNKNELFKTHEIALINNFFKENYDWIKAIKLIGKK